MIGLFGGAFNPPHLGHLELARRAIEEFDLDRLDVLVSGDPAHKRVDCPVDVRVALAELAFADVPQARVVADPYRYTIDRLRAEPPPEDAIFLMGAEFTWVYAHEHGSRRGKPRPGALNPPPFRHPSPAEPSR